MSLEENLIAWIKAQSEESELIITGVGDDAAVVEPTDEKQVFTTDLLIQGVHFEADAHPQKIGWKAAARSISDLAAMATRPLYLLVAIALGADLPNPEHYFQQIYTGILRLAAKFKVSVIGGDISRSAGGTTICVTAVGESYSRKPVNRSGAHVTDIVFVTGELGGSIMGRHLDFKPRVHEALILNRRYRINAMIDISDGLVKDMGRICTASGVGVVFQEASLPYSRAAAEQSKQTGFTPLEHALYDGEDYELLFVVPDFEAESIKNELPFLKPRLTEIGHIATRGIRLKRADGNMVDLAIAGWDSMSSPFS